MSLFENPEYRWRETYFVLFKSDHRPGIDAVQEALSHGGTKYEVTEMKDDGHEHFETATLVSPHDFAAMDVSYIEGEDVLSHIEELNEQIKTMSLSGDELRKLSGLDDCNSRFDVYHFEKITGDEDDFLDPGSLLIVLERLAKLCNGVAVDQSGTLI